MRVRVESGYAFTLRVEIRKDPARLALQEVAACMSKCCVLVYVCPACAAVRQMFLP